MRPPVPLHAALILGGLLVPGALAAQLPRTTARALGMMHSQTAAARGYEAIAWNPALLGMPGRPGFSLSLPQAALGTWSNAFSAGDVLKYEGDTLTTADKDTILAKIPLDRRLQLGGAADVMAVALTIGNFGISVGGVGDARVDVSRDFAELLLFGNITRRTPSAPPYDADRSAVAGWGGATVALAYGRPIGVPTGHLAVGATLKLTQGIAVAGVQDLGSFLRVTPFEAEGRVHALYVDPDSGIGNGLGFGADLGVAYELLSGVRLGLTIENVLSVMSWNEDALLYQRREYRLEQDGDTYADSVISEVQEGPYDATDPLQLALRDSVIGRATFPTRVRVGAQLALGPVLLAGDAMVQLKRGLAGGDATRVSVAAELPLKVVAVRGGVATDFSGLSFGGGLGFRGGPARFDLAANLTPGGDRQGLVVGAGLSIMP